METEIAKVYLSRRNLLTLLAKLDGVKQGEASACTIIKRDTTHNKYAASCVVAVIAVEDAAYYDRPAGAVRASDEERMQHGQ